MIVEGIRNRNCSKAEGNGSVPGIRMILLQAVATSIDALSIGFITVSNNTPEALMSSLIIGITTFFICLGGVHVGKVFGEKLSFFGQILGGIILIIIAFRLIL